MSNSTNHTIEKLSKKIKFYKIALIIISLCLFIVLVLYVLVKTSNSDASFGKFKLLDPARVFLSPGDYLLNIQELRNYLFDLEKQYPDSISIYYEQINSGSNISVNKDLHLFPASLSKLAQAIIVAKKVEESIFSWDKKIKILKEDLSSGSGTLYQRVSEGSEISVEELVKELLVNSDNTAQNVFRRFLSVTDYLNFQDLTGLQDLYNENGFISAKEYTRLLRVLYTSIYLEPENSEKILEYMSAATFKDYLSQGIPSEVKFAHKYGENVEYNIFADSGIVYIPDRPYMLTVIIKGKDSSLETRAWAMNLMKEISIRAYEISK